MSKSEKLLAAVKNNPKTVRFEDLNKILLDAGFRVTQEALATTRIITMSAH